MNADPVSSLLTKVRNASRAKHPVVDVPSTNLIRQILAVLKREGFIRNYKVAGQAPKLFVRVYLKYTPDRTPSIMKLVRISRPGQRSYCGASDLPRVLNGVGRAILTTSKGVITDQEARRQRIGGEVLCHVW